MLLGRVMGVNLRVHYLFLLPLLAFAATGRLAEGLLAFLAVFLHELGHLTTARTLGMTPREVVLLPFGGVASIEQELGLDPGVEMQVALAGPWVNIVIIGGLLIWRAVAGSSPALDFFMETNIMLAGFNLLPALPLDGGRVFRAHLVRQHGFRSGTIRAARVSKVCSLLFLVLGVVGFFITDQSINLIVMAVFLYISAERIRKQASYQLLAYLSSKQRELAIAGSLEATLLVVTETVRAGELLSQLVPKRYCLLQVIDRAGRLRGQLSEQQLLQGVLEHGLEVELRQLFD